MRAGRSLSPTAGKLRQTLETLAQGDSKR